jgi:hypothetical protein
MIPYEQYWLICWGPAGQLLIRGSPEVSVRSPSVLIRFEIPITQTMTVDFVSLVDEHGRVIRSGPPNKPTAMRGGDTVTITFALGANS